MVEESVDRVESDKTNSGSIIPRIPLQTGGFGMSISGGYRPTIRPQLPPITNNVNKKRRKKQRIFAKDIENLLYAMGDRPTSTDMTVQALEDILIEYLTDISYKLAGFAKTQNRTRVKLNDLSVVLKDDPVKLARLHYIMETSYRIERAKKMFEDKGGDDDEDDDEDNDEDIGEGEEETNKESGSSNGAVKKEKRKYTKRTDKGSKAKKKRKVTGNVMFKNEDDDDN
ncbi:transcription initiation factor IID, 18kD subunit-domain-containing protein [Scheffersomyces amazonensis]|uniref:transcription initiation factor IID, 18kD subunit-domain-containing protein n=1 Tax=Scheffersomyces amazonensis TaxID=1078765 RepID=UPI00315D3BC0